jgi:excisionase family DNA binding protein
LPNEDVTQDGVSELVAQRTSGLSRATLRRLIKNGEIRATKVGGARRIDEHSLEKYMRDRGYAEQLRLFG